MRSNGPIASSVLHLVRCCFLLSILNNNLWNKISHQLWTITIEINYRKIFPAFLLIKSWKWINFVGRIFSIDTTSTISWQWRIFKNSLMKNHTIEIKKINYILSRNQFITHILCQLMINRPKLQGIHPEIDIHKTGSVSLFTWNYLWHYIIFSC